MVTLDQMDLVFDQSVSEAYFSLNCFTWNILSYLYFLEIVNVTYWVSLCVVNFRVAMVRSGKIKKYLSVSLLWC